MASIYTETFEGGTLGSAVTTANANFVTVTPNVTFDNTHLLTNGGGTRAGKFAATTAAVQVIAEFAATATVYSRFYVYLEALPSGTLTIYTLFTGATAGATVTEVRVTTAGALQLRNSNLTQVAVSAANAVPTGRWVRIEHLYNNNTGRQQVRLYASDPHAATPDYDSGLVATTAAGTVSRFASGVNNSMTLTAWFDNYAVDNAAFPAPTGTPAGGGGTGASVNAGADQTVGPWTPVTLSASSAGSPTSWNWSQRSGPAVNLSGATTSTVTFEAAPSTFGSAVRVFRATATYAGGTTNFDDVQVTTTPVGVRMVGADGVERPLRILSLAAPGGVPVDPPPVTNKMLFGMVNFTALTGIDGQTNNIGPNGKIWGQVRDAYHHSNVRLRRAFNSGMPTTWAGTNGASTPAGNVVFQSVRSSPADMIAGVNDAAIEGMVASAPPHTWWTWLHEMEDEVMRGQFTAQDWASGFKRFHQRVKSVRSDAYTAPVHMSFQWEPGQAATATPGFYDVDGNLDALFTDTYFMQWNTGKKSITEHPGHMRWHQWASTVGVPLGIAEFGIVHKVWDNPHTSFTRPYTDAQKATLLGNTLDWCRANGYRAFTYWNCIDGPSGSSWVSFHLNPSVSDSETQPLTLDAWNSRAGAWGDTDYRPRPV